MQIQVHPKSNVELTDETVEAINKRTIYWSDDRLCHWFFDFKINDVWISQVYINNELTHCTVKLEK